MKTGNRILGFLLSLVLVFSLCTTVLAEGETSDADSAEDPSTAETDEESPDETEEPVITETITISSTEDFLSFAENCRTDSWSVNKEIILQADISLAGTAFVPIASFSGIFKGSGHTISGLSLTGHLSAAGLFARVEAGAQIWDLNVSGTINMASSCETAGGIAGRNYGTIQSCSFSGSVEANTCTGGICGINELTGSIRSCTSTGSVSGTAETGGIVGENNGAVSGCTNTAYINTSSSDNAIALNNVNLDFSLDTNQLLSGSDVISLVKDTGGIAGYNTGTLMNCTNNSLVGYQHVGYNVGGISGRSCGFITGCTNNGSVYGRKDVGGILGQMEPYVLTNLSESALATLQQQLQELSDLVDKAANDAQGGADGVSSQLNSMSGSVSGALSKVNELSSILKDSSSDSGSSELPIIPDDTDKTVDFTVDPDSGSASVDISDDAGSAGISIDSDGTVSADINGETVIQATPDLSGITGAINSIGSQLSALNGSLSGAVGTVADDVRAINSKFNEVSNTLFDAIYSMNTTASEIVEDTSDFDIDLVTLGKVLLCENTGVVQGDIDVGGIAGTMALDSADDQESDSAEDLSAATQSEYEIKAIIQSCTNRGVIEAKRSYAGGICGRMALGLITNSSNFANITSESGDYVGGITGIAASTVRGCFADCTLSGGQYVGGITGSGVTQSLTGETSTVTGCYSLVEITACTQYEGAISGAEAGSYLGNYFVSDSLQGIDGLNTAGKAEPISYSDLLLVENLPDEMKMLTLSFVADGKVLKSSRFQYGASFDEDVYPEIPEKDGYYGVWDRTELNDLRFNTVVSVVYTQYITALPSSSTRDSGRSVFIVLGNYDDRAQLTTIAETQSVSDFAPLSSGLKTAAAHYLATISGHKFMDTAVNRSVEEQWSITLPDDGQMTHTVRYLSPEETTENIDLYVKQGSGWKRLDCTAFGSYLEFTLEGTTAEIAVVQVLPIVWIWLAILGAFLLVVLTVALLIRRAQKLRQRRLKHRAGKAGAAAADSVENNSEKSKKERHYRAWIIPLVILLILLLVVCGVIWRYVDTLGNSLVPYTMLRELSQRSDLSMQLQLDADLGGEETSLAADLSTISTESGKVTAVTSDDITFYYSNGAVILENGRIFRLEDSFPDYSDLLKLMVPLLKNSDLTIDSSVPNVWTISLGNSGARTLLDALMPSLGSAVSDMDQAELILSASETALNEIDLYISGHLSNEHATAFSLHAVLTGFGSGTAALPDPVADAVNAGLTGSEPVITQDVLNLAAAWTELNSRAVIAADIALKVNAGPIVLNDTLQFASKDAENGQRIWHISKNLLNVYGCGSKVVTSDGAALTDDNAELAGTEQLLNAAYAVCMKGSLSRAEKNNTITYTVNLTGSDLKELAEYAVPQLADQILTLSYGSLTLTLEDGTVSSLSFSCTGSVRVVLVDADVSITDTIVFKDGSDDDFTVPEAVRNALMPEE